MEQYIGTKIVEAEEAYQLTWPDKTKTVEPKRDLMVLPAGVKVEEGYRVRYADGYTSWSPKAVFERAYLKLEVNQELRTDAPSISATMVNDFLREWEVTTLGDKTTVVRAVLLNGFEIVESSACVSAENYDEKLGAEICLGKIRDKVWMLLGFLLQTAVHGVAMEEPCGEMGDPEEPNGVYGEPEAEAAAQAAAPAAECCGKAPEKDFTRRGGLAFGGALEMMKMGKGVRLPDWSPDVTIRAQYPDEHSKMTAPYLYVESRFGKVPWKETMIELFREDWEVVE